MSGAAMAADGAAVLPSVWGLPPPILAAADSVLGTDLVLYTTLGSAPVPKRKRTTPSEAAGSDVSGDTRREYTNRS